jgi:glycerol dehydrogenase-like iron-containing ADH family enzyme
VASNNGKPIIITVPEERLYEKISGQKFSRFLAKYGFSIYSAELGRYRPGKIEYVLYKS